jgi:hypothetical protein
MNQTLLALALLTIAGSAVAQPANFPATNSTPITPPSVPAGAPTTASGLPPAMGAPDELTSRYGGPAAAPDLVSPPLTSGSAAAPGAAEAPTPTRGDNPGAMATAAPPVNAPGSDAAVRAIQADGYKNVQGLTRGADGRWHGKALRGTTLVDVSVDGRGAVTSP